jgi:hypothetical protein
MYDGENSFDAFAPTLSATAGTSRHQDTPTVTPHFTDGTPRGVLFGSLTRASATGTTWDSQLYRADLAALSAMNFISRLLAESLVID